MSLGASVMAVAVLGLTAFGLEPSLPRSVYYGQWTPRLDHLEWYRGRVLQAYLGPMEIRSRRRADDDSVRALIRGGAAWRVSALAGPTVPAVASLISIYDTLDREIALIGPDRDDLVYRIRRRSAPLRLDQPDIRLVGAMQSVSPGDTLEIGVVQGPSGLCLSLGDRQDCGLGLTAGHGWTLLFYAESLPAGFKRILNPAWLALLFLPAGFWAVERWAAIQAVALALGGLMLAPALSSLAATTPFEYLGALAGLAAGWLLQRQLPNLASVARGDRAS